MNPNYLGMFLVTIQGRTCHVLYGLDEVSIFAETLHLIDINGLLMTEKTQINNDKE